MTDDTDYWNIPIYYDLTQEIMPSDEDGLSIREQREAEEYLFNEKEIDTRDKGKNIVKFPMEQVYANNWERYRRGVYIDPRSEVVNLEDYR